MRISPISSLNNNLPMQGKVSRETAGLIQEIADSWIYKISDKKIENEILQKSFMTSITRVENVLENLNSLMLRFGHDCRLSFVKSKKNNTYRFFVEHKASNYKLPIKDINLSEEKNSLDDINEIEELEDTLLKVNPYVENSHFIIQRTDTGIVSDSRFMPDKDMIFVEDFLMDRIRID